MKNPIAKHDMFATPASAEDFRQYLAQFTGKEAVLVITVAQMALNLASTMVDAEIAKSK